jgi:hypothetical protein
VDADERGLPYRHWLCRGVVPAGLIAAARGAIPAADDPAWIRYDNELERGKWAMERYDALPPPWQALMGALRAPALVADLSALIGVQLQAPETISRGGGLHLMFPKGYLQTHVDYALHPSGLERRANLILFLTDDGTFEDAGELLLLGTDLTCGVGFRPEAGKAVLWECGDQTYHEVQPLGPRANPRVTAAAYYLAPPRPGCTRTRALFLPRR